MYRNILSSSKPIRTSAGVAAGVGDVVSTVPVTGFTGALIMVSLAVLAAGATASVKVRGGQLADGSDAVDLKGTLVSTGDTNDNKLLLLDIHKPAFPYLTVVVGRAGANVALDAVTVLLYNPTISPVESDVSVAAQRIVSDPRPGVA